VTIVEDEIGSRIEDCVGGGCEEGEGERRDGGVDLENGEDATSRERKSVRRMLERE